MKALLLSELGIDVPASRARVFQYLPHLARLGIEAEVVAGLPGFGDLLGRAGQVDAVLLQRRALPWIKLAALRARARRLIFDLDDSIWLRRNGTGKVVPVRASRRARLKATVRWADGVIAGNDFLAAWVRSVSSKAALAIVPTPIDPAYYAAGKRRPEGGPVVLGWVGARDNLPYLEALEPVFEKVRRRCPDVRLRVVCNGEYRGRALPVENVPWSLQKEVENIADCHLGLMPLSDDDWTRGKCSYKAIQFMAVGLPVVASPVGMNREVIREGETGLLASDPASWEESLVRLIGSAELRRRLGDAARAYVTVEFDVARLAERVAAMLRG